MLFLAKAPLSLFRTSNLLSLTSRLREVGFLRVERIDLQKFNLDGEVCKTSESLNRCYIRLTKGKT